MADDIFCKVVSGEIPKTPVYQDDSVMVIHDIHPHAPVHLLVIPKEHYQGVGDTPESVMGHMLTVAHQMAAQEGLVEGYRLIINEGQDSGKVVPHLHLHILGGKPLGPKLVSQ